jgi:hypothetical protein
VALSAGAEGLVPLSWHHVLKVLPYGTVVVDGPNMISHMNGRLEVTATGSTGSST